MMRDMPVLGLACVIDRPGYNARYLRLYEYQPWLLCKTAFNVIVERAAKFAISNTKKLRIYPERCNISEDRLLSDYYDALRVGGMPFANESSAKYKPLTADNFNSVLYEFKTKRKSSPLVQLADLYLWPICMGGYHKSNRPYKRLLDDGKLIECRLCKDDWAAMASKYSCFEAVKIKL